VVKHLYQYLLDEEPFEDNWLAGLADGEGCFYIRSKHSAAYTIIFQINLRADDKKILQNLQAALGGSLTFHSVPEKQVERIPGAKPTYSLTVCARRDVLRLIEYFDEYPLRLKKREEYVVWREAAMLYYRYSVGQEGQHGNPLWLAQAMEQYKAELSRLKEYGEQPTDLTIEPADPQLELFAAKILSQEDE